MTSEELRDLAHYCAQECDDTPVMVLKLLSGLADKVAELEQQLYDHRLHFHHNGDLIPTEPF